MINCEYKIVFKIFPSVRFDSLKTGFSIPPVADTEISSSEVARTLVTSPSIGC